MEHRFVVGVFGMPASGRIHGAASFGTSRFAVQGPTDEMCISTGQLCRPASHSLRAIGISGVWQLHAGVPAPSGFADPA
jgi:hypothetical protein